MSRREATFSEEETRARAKAFGALLKPGDVVALTGDLGSGKTQFVKGLGEAFGVARVSSPTFVFVHRYEGRGGEGTDVLIYHFDLYRLSSPEEIYDLGYEEFFFGDGICVVEWADRLGPLLPARRYDIRLEFGTQENERIITIGMVGGVSAGGGKGR